MRQYEMAELSFRGPEPKGAPTDAEITGTFAKDGVEKTVPGFYAGDGTYKIRFYPEEAGTYTYKVTGEVTAEGSLIAEKAAGHGMVKAVGTHFEYEDGTPFYPFGTTIYALAHQTKDLMAETMETLKKAPFNKVRMCVFPKDYRYNKNDPAFFPFAKREDGSWDVTHPDCRFWDAFEEKITALGSMGIEVDLILFHPYDRWGFASMSQQDNLIYLSYLMKRFAAYPNIWWSLSNEYDFTPTKTLEDWEEIEKAVHDLDPYHHLESCHNGFHYWDATRKDITHSSLQVKSLPVVTHERARTGKPVMIDECSYEGNLNESWGAISGEEMTAHFWQAVALGGYCTHGETFLDPDTKDEDSAVVFWAKGGKLIGKSPERIAWLRNIVESLPGPIDPQTGRFGNLFDLSSEEMDDFIDKAPKQHKFFFNSMKRLTEYEKGILRAGEYSYAGQVGEKAYLWYLYRQTSARYEILLPETHTYKVEVLDTWEMTRTTFAEHASGSVLVRLPGKEYMAILATIEA